MLVGWLSVLFFGSACAQEMVCCIINRRLSCTGMLQYCTMVIILPAEEVLYEMLLAFCGVSFSFRSFFLYHVVEDEVQFRDMSRRFSIF